MADPTRTALDKTALRRSMREQRRALPDRPERSLVIWDHVRSVPAVASAHWLPPPALLRLLLKRGYLTALRMWPA